MVASEDIEKEIEELQTSRDYTALMELAQFDEEETTRNMALFAIGKLSHDENDEAVIDRTVEFLSQAIHQDLFPTVFGEIESFWPLDIMKTGLSAWRLHNWLSSPSGMRNSRPKTSMIYYSQSQRRTIARVSN